MKNWDNGQKLEKSVKILSYNKIKEMKKVERVNVGLISIHWKPDASNNNIKRSSKSHDKHKITLKNSYIKTDFVQ